MEQKKNLCAAIDRGLHQQVRDEQAQTGKSLGEYIEMVLTEYYNMKRGGISMATGKTRTLAFQVSEELFQKVKEYLADHDGMSQKDFVVGLIEQAIAEWEAAQTTEQPPAPTTPPCAPVGYDEAEAMADAALIYQVNTMPDDEDIEVA